MRIISQRVAPRASAASLCVAGVWANTSRERAVTIGRIMIDSTIPTKKMVPALSTAGVVAEEAGSSRGPR